MGQSSGSFHLFHIFQESLSFVARCPVRSPIFLCDFLVLFKFYFRQKKSDPVTPSLLEVEVSEEYFLMKQPLAMH